MQEELASIIDQVFGEFIFTTTSAVQTKQQTECIPRADIANEDSDWYDVPVDDLAIDPGDLGARQPRLQECGHRLVGLARHVGRALRFASIGMTPTVRLITRISSYSQNGFQSIS